MHVIGIYTVICMYLVYGYYYYFVQEISYHPDNIDYYTIYAYAGRNRFRILRFTCTPKIKYDIPLRRGKLH